MIGVIIFVLFNLILWFTLLMIGHPEFRSMIWTFTKALICLALGLLCFGTVAAIVVASVASKL